MADTSSSVKVMRAMVEAPHSCNSGSAVVLRGKRLQTSVSSYAAAGITKSSPEATCPMILVDWYMAAAYCNWLSDQENLEKCYEEDAQGKVVGLKAKYLSLTGYRLPTEAEWEYACRAKAVTSRYYGEAEELLPKYGWYLGNSGDWTRPVGGKKPNDLGLF